MFVAMATYKPQAVQRLFATASAFAALLADGSVVTWGDPEAGGDATRSVQEKLKEVGSEGRTCGGDGKRAKRDIRKRVVVVVVLLLLLLLVLLLLLLLVSCAWCQVRHS